MGSPLTVVTGATGHLGANLVRLLLSRGARIRAVTIEPTTQTVPALAGLAVERHQADVTNPTDMRRALSGADTVYHLAGMISIVRRDSDRLWHVNVDGARTVASVAREVGVRRLVHVSSVQTLAPGGVLDEESPQVGHDAPAYDRSKLAGERAVLDEVHRGLDAVIVLPTAIVGPNDHGPSRTGRNLIRLWRGRLPAITAGGHDWVDVRDVALGMVAAAERGRTGGRYLLSGHWAPVPELARRAAGVVGLQGPAAVVPAGLALTFGPVVEQVSAVLRREPTFTAAAIRALQHHEKIDRSRAGRELDYRPRPLVQTLYDTHAWWRRSRPPTAPPTRRREPAANTAR